MPSKKCPNCDLIHPVSAMMCDCGYSFSQGTARKSLQEQAQSIREENISKIRADSDVIEEERDKGLSETSAKRLDRYRNITVVLLVIGFLPRINDLLNRDLPSLISNSVTNPVLWVALLFLFLYVRQKDKSQPHGIKEHRVRDTEPEEYSDSEILLSENPDLGTGQKEKTKGYVRRHWRGQLSLPVSFWLNVFLLNIALTTTVGWSLEIEHPQNAARFLVMFSLITLLVYPWQVIGLWRCCSRIIEERGKAFWARAARVIVVLGILAACRT